MMVKSELPNNTIKYYYDHLEEIFSEINYYKTEPIVNHKKLSSIIVKSNLLDVILISIRNLMPDFQLGDSISSYYKLIGPKMELFFSKSSNPGRVKQLYFQSIESKYILQYETEVLKSYQFYIQYSIYKAAIDDKNADLFRNVIKFLDWRLLKYLSLREPELMKGLKSLYNEIDLLQGSAAAVYDPIGLKNFHFANKNGVTNSQKWIQHCLTSIYQGWYDSELLVRGWDAENTKKIKNLTFNETFYLLKRYFITSDSLFSTMAGGPFYKLLSLLSRSKPETISSKGFTGFNDTEYNLMKKKMKRIDQEIDSYGKINIENDLIFNETYYLLKKYFTTSDSQYERMAEGSKYKLLSLLIGGQLDGISLNQSMEEKMQRVYQEIDSYRLKKSKKHKN